MNTLKLIVLGSVIALVVFGLITFDKNYIVKVLNQYKLLPQPEPFTELYFEDHLKLPKLHKINEPYSFKFTVHNLENKDFTYNYLVTATASDSASILDKGKFSLKSDQSKTFKENFRIRLPYQKVKFNIDLPNKNQSIHFYTEIIY